MASSPPPSLKGQSRENFPRPQSQPLLCALQQPRGPRLGLSNLPGCRELRPLGPLLQPPVGPRPSNRGYPWHRPRPGAVTLNRGPQCPGAPPHATSFHRCSWLLPIRYRCKEISGVINKVGVAMEHCLIERKCWQAWGLKELRTVG